MEERIKQNLQKSLNPTFLEVKNNSYLHKGHSGDNGTMETHFSIKVEAAELKNLTRIKAHQKINKIIEQEFKNGLHALEISIL